MTAVTVRTTAAAPRSRGPRGLVWMMLRVHQSALLFWLMLVAVVVGGLLWAHGPGADAAWEEYRDMGCGSGEPGLGCDLTGPAFGRYDDIVSVSGSLIAVRAGAGGRRRPRGLAGPLQPAGEAPREPVADDHPRQSGLGGAPLGLPGDRLPDPGWTSTPVPLLATPVRGERHPPRRRGRRRADRLLAAAPPHRLNSGAARPSYGWRDVRPRHVDVREPPPGVPHAMSP